jgi:hypothetical protein
MIFSIGQTDTIATHGSAHQLQTKFLAGADFFLKIVLMIIFFSKLKRFDMLYCSLHILLMQIAHFCNFKKIYSR